MAVLSCEVKICVLIYFQNYDSSNFGDNLFSLPQYLKRPVERIDEYIGFLRDCVKYSTKASENCSQLEEAVKMLMDLKKQIDDLELIERIQGYPGQLNDLGPILRHVS